MRWRMHEARVGRDLVLLPVAAHEADRVPVVRAQLDALAARKLDGDLLRPLDRIHEIAVGV